MSKNRPRRPVCAGKMKKNGTTTKGTTRWRCISPDCGASTTKKRTDLTHIADFKAFISYTSGNHTLSQLAEARGCSRWTLNRTFEPFWLIDIPNTPDKNRIYDQVFIDGTYTNGGCLLIAASRTHVLCWHWCKTESTKAYKRLLSKLQPPLCVVLDGGLGAWLAIKALWPNTMIQRCLVHAQRVVRRYLTSRPRTDAGKALYYLALRLTKIKDLNTAREWVTLLHECGQVYRTFLNEKTKLPKHRDPTGTQWEFTHIRVRQAFNSLKHLANDGYLFGFLQPPPKAIEPELWVATTNSLEGGINSQLKLLARMHRGRSGERQRTMLEWWLYSKTQLPDDPVEIAKQCNWGNDQLAKVTVITHNENQADYETGRPALYDNGIGTDYQHHIGIRKGWVGR
ncbi:IS1249 family transposase [Corynebacterium diphtheriae]|uniref:IS1249 family transposase n=1 Tax=Corynebacterium diphtheriae TaxID=1717 RepID=UPI00086E093B|nr:IS1249 family transposase [Corynebacterium diphtheriae]ODS16575.1 transposase [Corynebacterium diphtheriae]OLN13015.1 IS256 family transposase [Corynebacterium diphtheriae]QBY11439.1 IS1249 family transposase [Corynebacterium diphtheriae]RKW90719.1 IS1249 family transposase [Corynebacterium diphtheriae]RLP08056.1 IS1249 family transposase [Corynebacterium diphtheriae]